ncbi:MAG: 1,6-anhydro-N-acetylmuramyl-L-alanine amidase AmpD [Gammaproteobacteria bacterium]|nr:1,6-anhydro-N-acetylmuramyl-L-alanine amidase AmpD [Gammaproteobacteria bacterium]
MTILTIDAAGWLQTAEVVRSPNYDMRPKKSKIKLIVIHGISLPPGEFGGGYIQHFFCNQLDANQHEFFIEIVDMCVSAHCLIERNGHIVQFVSFLDRAWHAGASSWHGEQACNDYSIGIELEGTDIFAYSDSQYHQLCSLIKTLSSHFPAVEPDSVCGHSDIAPGRKTDPGPSFDWSRLRKLLE